MYDRSFQTETAAVRASQPSKQSLFKALAGAAAVVCLGALTLAWLTSDYTGEYYANDPQLGPIRLQLTRKATGVAGQLTVGTDQTLETISGDVSDTGTIDLAFAPQAAGQQRFATAEFQGMIDPKQAEQSETTISFNQVLHPYLGNAGNATNIAVTVPRLKASEKLIAGVLNYGGFPFKLVFRRNGVHSLFQQMKSLCPSS